MPINLAGAVADLLWIHYSMNSLPTHRTLTEIQHLFFRCDRAPLKLAVSVSLSVGWLVGWLTMHTSTLLAYLALFFISFFFFFFVFGKSPL